MSVIMGPRLLAADWLDRLIDWAAGLPERVAWFLSLGMILMIATLDWATGRNVTLNGFYILSICLASWSLGLKGGLILGLLYGAITAGLNGYGDSFNAYSDDMPIVVAMWNLSMRGFWVAVMVVLVAGFRRSYNLQRRRARTDDLTGALTKHAFRDYLGRAITAATRRGRSLVLIYSDLDGFKSVNDRFGHAAGDEVLVAFADAASRSIRNRDVLARMGGDEFVMLLTVEDSADGFTAAQRLHLQVGAALALLPYPVTASMGAAVVERPDECSEARFLKMADALMYEVKRAGKNALRVAYVDRPDQILSGDA